MKRKVRAYPFEVKEVSTAGEFSGYGSVYGNLDSYREIVAPGAFSKSLGEWRGKSRFPPVLWQHREPIGAYTEMKEDSYGLHVTGQLLIDDVQKAREARALMSVKAVSGLSIGYDVVSETYNKDEKSITLNELKLFEVSIVTFPANDIARVEAVKDRFEGKLPTLREFEDHLREAGFSRQQAKAIAGQGLTTLLREAEATGDEEDTISAVDVKSILEEVFRT